MAASAISDETFAAPEPVPTRCNAHPLTIGQSPVAAGQPAT
jgi:hypothetical protein